jgi:hypothetical protein
LEEFQMGQDNCTKNTVSEAYQDTYFAEARSGWQFRRWAHYCTNVLIAECSFNVPAGMVERFEGVTVPPLTAIFRPTVNTGFDALLMGHSFFNPFALGLPAHAAQGGFTEHDQTAIFVPSENGAPLALWNDPVRRAEIQTVLDAGETELFGMTYHYNYPTMDGYRQWVKYALQKNPDTRFFIATTWERFPIWFNSADYEDVWNTFHTEEIHSKIDTLRAEFPGVDFYCIPTGQVAVELHKLFNANDPDLLADLSDLYGSYENAVFEDAWGHPGELFEALGQLVWFSSIYHFELDSYPFSHGYTTDIKAIAKAVVDGHDANYNAPPENYPAL